MPPNACARSCVYLCLAAFQVILLYSILVVRPPSMMKTSEDMDANNHWTNISSEFGRWDFWNIFGFWKNFRLFPFVHKISENHFRQTNAKQWIALLAAECGAARSSKEYIFLDFQSSQWAKQIIWDCNRGHVGQWRNSAFWRLTSAGRRLFRTCYFVMLSSMI